MQNIDFCKTSWSLENLDYFVYVCDQPFIIDHSMNVAHERDFATFPSLNTKKFSKLWQALKEFVKQQDASILTYIDRKSEREYSNNSRYSLLNNKTWAAESIRSIKLFRKLYLQASYLQPNWIKLLTLFVKYCNLRIF